MADPIKVLIADDHRILVEPLSLALGLESDVEVVGVAYDGEQAIAEAVRLRPDVVLMDYQLPLVDGIAATRAIRAANPATQVVMLTSSTDERLAIKALEAGASGYVTKDRPPSEVVRAIRSAHDGEAVIPPSLMPALLSQFARRVQAFERRTELAEQLTRREVEVLQLLAKGLDAHAITAKLVVSPNTLRAHTANILRKLDAHSKLEAVTTALRLGLIELPE